MCNNLEDWIATTDKKKDIMKTNMEVIGDFNFTIYR